MSKFTSRQWIAVVGGVLFFSVLFFINRKAPASETPLGPQGSEHAGNGPDFDQIIQESEDSIPAPEKQVVDRIKNTLANSPDSTHPHLLARLVQVLDSIGQPIIAAYYTEKLAAIENSPGLWTHAGQQFYDYSALSKDNTKEVLVKQAEQCFNHSIKIDSTYAEAQVGIGECLVDEGTNPMKGIMTIEAVLRKDSNNRNAQIALGKFSIRSNQFDKAIYRFKRVLQIDPTYKEAYLYLAQSYEESGNKHEAIANLKKYRIFAPDSAIKTEIDNYIKEKLENDTTNNN
jgi:tetratricopeptide (TPR) repeat protein